MTRKVYCLDSLHTRIILLKQSVHITFPRLACMDRGMRMFQERVGCLELELAMAQNEIETLQQKNDKLSVGVTAAQNRLKDLQQDFSEQTLVSLSCHTLATALCASKPESLFLSSAYCIARLCQSERLSALLNKHSFLEVATLISEIHVQLRPVCYSCNNLLSGFGYGGPIYEQNTCCTELQATARGEG